MKKAFAGVAALAFLLVAATPVSEPMRDRIIADARAVPPTSLAFDRSTRVQRKGGGITSNVTLVERWDGQRWTLISKNGLQPSAAERRDVEKLASASPVPGYHRLASLLAAATDISNDAQGNMVLHIPVLPPGSVRTDTSDISSHLRAEAVVSNRGGQPFVESVRLSQREPFKMNALIKVKTFDQVSTYKLDASGRPRLARQSDDSKGSMFGFPGGQSSETVYTYR
jgi:hypothetical protein